MKRIPVSEFRRLGFIDAASEASADSPIGKLLQNRVAVSVNEFAAASGISRPSIYRYMATGQLRYSTLGDEAS